MKKLLPIFFLLLSTSLQGCSQARIHNRAFDATFALYAEKGDKSRFVCTATAYEQLPESYHLITAGHCVLGYADNGVTFSVAKTIRSPRRGVKVVKAMRQGS